jgi:hypothetical protein
MLVRWMRGRPAFTDKDWLFLFGHAPEKVFLLHLWLRFAVIWIAVVLIGFVEGYVLLPFGLAAFLGSLFLTALVVWRCCAEVVRFEIRWKPSPLHLFSSLSHRINYPVLKKYLRRLAYLQGDVSTMSPAPNAHR